MEKSLNNAEIKLVTTTMLNTVFQKINIVFGILLIACLAFPFLKSFRHQRSMQETMGYKKSVSVLAGGVIGFYIFGRLLSYFVVKKILEAKSHNLEKEEIRVTVTHNRRTFLKNIISTNSKNTKYKSFNTDLAAAKNLTADETVNLIVEKSTGTLLVIE